MRQCHRRKSPIRNLPTASALDQSTPYQVGDGEPGQQRGGGREGVKGGQVFAVGDEPLEDAAGEVVGVFDAGCIDGLGGVPQPVQYSGGVGGVEDAPVYSLAMAKMGQ